MKTLCANILLLLLTATVIVHSKQYIASEVIYNKLEDALFSNKSVLYMMQEVFIPSKLLPRNLVYLYVCMTIGGVALEVVIAVHHLVDRVTSHTASGFSGAVLL